MLLDLDDCQLVLVDYQAKLMPVIGHADEVLARALLLARAARLLGVPVWGTEQNPNRLGPNAPELRALCQQTFSKMHFSACTKSDSQALRPSPSAKPCSSPAAKRMCACCKARSACWSRSLRSGS